MAKKKDKPQVINNIGELNIEIDYDKLAEAIVKAQNQSTIIESYNEGSEGGYEYIQKTLSGKIKRNYFTFSLSKLICWMFYAMGIGEVYLTIIFIPIINNYIYELALSQNYSIFFARIIGFSSAIAFLFIAMLIFCVLFNIAFELKKEQDRNYIISVFSGIVSFAALIVALVALFKGVG